MKPQATDACRRDLRWRDDPTYRRLLGEPAWRRLSPAIRLRFGLKPAPGRRLVYQGVMREVRCSRLGALLAHLCRAIGTPLAPYRGRDVPTRVQVFPEARGGGIVWRRVYDFPGRRPSRVVSIKRPDDRAGLVERVGGGFGMILETFERDACLHFRSLGYFWEIAGWRLPLPGLLTPGVTHVVHADEADGRFCFRMTIRHPWLGETFFQDGLFRAVEGI
jgi:hypothetical protein